MPRFQSRLRAWLLAACALAPGLMQETFAAAPQVHTQGAGFYRMMLGDVEITALLDGTHPFPVDTVMEHVSAPDVQRDLAQAALTLPVQGSINAFLVNTGSALILIDTLEMLEHAAAADTLVAAAHIAFPGLGHIRKTGTTCDWIPINDDATAGATGR